MLNCGSPGWRVLGQAVLVYLAIASFAATAEDSQPALIPLRSRTVVAMRIGIHLVKTGDLWGLDIPAVDTKNRRPLDYPIPTELSARIDLYLEQFRSRIPGGAAG
jgi:hypothetical protein